MLSYVLATSLRCSSQMAKKHIKCLLKGQGILKERCICARKLGHWVTLGTGPRARGRQVGVGGSRIFRQIATGVFGCRPWKTAEI